MNKSAKSQIDKICSVAFVAVFVIMLLINGVRWFMDGYTLTRENFESRFAAFPAWRIENSFKQIFWSYLSFTNRAIENDVIILNDGRRIFLEEPLPLSMFERAETVITINNYLAGKDIPFLLVRVPNGIRDATQLPFRVAAGYTQIEDTDMFMARLREGGVDTLDLREEMIQDNVDFSKIYYRNDHHWNAYGGLYAYGKIGATMNSDYGFNIDEKTWDINQYEAVTFHNAFVGSISKRLDNASEDITALFPKFDTDIEVSHINPFDPYEHMYMFASGDFRSIFVPKTLEGNVTEFNYEDLFATPWYGFSRIENRLAGEDKRIMLIGDSFGASMTYFSTGLTGVDHLTMSSERSPMMYPMLAEEHYDLVVFMLYEGVMLTENDDLSIGRFNFGVPVD